MWCHQLTVSHYMFMASGETNTLSESVWTLTVSTVRLSQGVAKQQGNTVHAPADGNQFLADNHFLDFNDSSSYAAGGGASVQPVDDL